MDISMSRQDAFEKSLSIIRTIVDSQIRDAARMGKQSVPIEIPRNIFGREPYDVFKMGKAVVTQLYEDKYEVTGSWSKFVVSWGRPESRRVKKPPESSGVIVVPVPQKQKK